MLLFVLFLCKYLRVFSQYLISHFTIVYKHMLILTSYLELENDRWTVETSFVFDVSFYYQISFKKFVDSDFLIVLKYRSAKPHLKVSRNRADQ